MLDVRAYFEGRESERTRFLTAHVGNDFTAQPFAADWASRRYFRVEGGEKTYVLMEAVPDHIPTATMGHKLSAFLKIARLLKDRGIHTPKIYAADEQEGFVLLEDLGDISFHDALQSGGNAMDIYGAATDALIAMRDRVVKDDLSGLPKYDESYIRKGCQRLVDWYVPATRGERNNNSLLKSYWDAWDRVIKRLPAPRVGFIHGDFHLRNLMLLPDGGCGVLDFQDAMIGPVGYDLANLLENIRVDVPQDVYTAMMDRYAGDESFRAWYRVMATQFHCRIAGQVLRLAILSGKTDLMAYMPRVQKYLIRGLQDPVLAPLADWFETENIDLGHSDFDPEQIKPFIRSDAF